MFVVNWDGLGMDPKSPSNPMLLCLAVFITHGAQKHAKAYFKVAAWDETGMTSTHTEIPRFLKRGLGRKKKHCSSQLHPRLKKTLGWKAPTLG